MCLKYLATNLLHMCTRAAGYNHSECYCNISNVPDMIKNTMPLQMIDGIMKYFAKPFYYPLHGYGICKPYFSV